MIKNINVNQLLFSDLFVKEPVDAVNEQITGDTTEGKIILTGSRGCGKSVVLERREFQSLNHPAILTRFDGAGIFGSKDGAPFNKSVMEHYYEVVMCKKFLNYVREFYPKVFREKFNDLNSITKRRLLEIDNFINDVMYRDIDLKQKLFTGEALSEMLSLFRSGTGAKSLTLMIDRFDWTHNSDPRVQDILKKYFSMFEKVILTSDDPTLSSDEKKVVSLNDKGYQLVSIDYARDLDTVIDVVERRFKFDEDTQSRFPIDEVVDEDYLRLIDRCGGNLDTILDTFQYAETLRKWDSEKDLSTIIDEACCEKVNSVKQLRKMCKPPKLHL